MKKTATVIVSTMVIAFVLTAAPLVSYAQPCDPTLSTCQSGTSNPSSQQGGTSNDGSAGNETIALPNPLGNQSDPQVIIGLVIRVVLGMVGSVALVFFIYGGLMMMTSAGNMDRVTKGRNTLVWASIGLVVIFTSYALVGFIIRSIPQ